MKPITLHPKDSLTPTRSMCSICIETLPSFGVEHTELLCPVRNSRYCSYCAQYGHLTKLCPAKPLRMYREPCYVEQLIPPTELLKYNITSRTPLRNQEEADAEAEAEKPRQLLEIKDNDKVIASYLTSMSIKVPKGYTKKQALEEFAKLKNKRLVYIL